MFPYEMEENIMLCFLIPSRIEHNYE